MSTYDSLASFKAVKEYYDGDLSKKHLKTLLTDSARNDSLRVNHGNVIFDFTHSKLDAKALELMIAFAKE